MTPLQRRIIFIVVAIIMAVLCTIQTYAFVRFIYEQYKHEDSKTDAKNAALLKKTTIATGIFFLLVYIPATYMDPQGRLNSL